MPSLAIPVSLFAALVFIIVSSPVTYKATNSLTSSVIKVRLSDAAGNPNNVGLVTHALVFFLAMWGFTKMNKV